MHKFLSIIPVQSKSRYFIHLFGVFKLNFVFDFRRTFEAENDTLEKNIKESMRFIVVITS